MKEKSLFFHELVSWCFEPSLPQRITSGLNSFMMIYLGTLAVINNATWISDAEVAHCSTESDLFEVKVSWSECAKVRHCFTFDCRSHTSVQSSERTRVPVPDLGAGGRATLCFHCRQATGKLGMTVFSGFRTR